MTYDYSTAFSHWQAEEQEAIARVQASGRWTMGAETEAFEHELAQYHGRKHAIAVNSGSSANLVAVAALFHLENSPIKAGMNALVPAIAWATTYAPLIQHGLIPLVADVGDDWNMKWDGTHAGKQIGVVVTVPILGNPVDYEKLGGAQLAPGPYVTDSPHWIEDACESLGASMHGRKCGQNGIMSTLSFFHSHQLSAIEGGAILTDDDECARLCRLVRNHGNAGFVDKQTDFDRSYDFVLFGYNVRPLELHAAIARAQLAKLDRFILARNENLAYFWTHAGELQRNGKLIRPRVNGSMSPFGLHFECEDNDARTRLVSALRAQGIDCRLPTGGSFRLHPYGAKWADQATPRADQIHRQGLFLGNAPFQIEDKIDRAIKVMREVL